MDLRLRDRIVSFPRPPILMGIVNLSPDSFSGDGVGDARDALDRALALHRDGAEIIDVGAESARTNRTAISEEDEIARYTAFLQLWRELPEPRPVLSLNTWRPAVIEAVLPLGGELINDISGLPTFDNARLCADHGAGLVIMHTVGAPKVAHTHVRHPDVLAAIDSFFAEKLALANSAGLPLESIILDPGIDFAKQRDENLTIYRNLERLRKFGRPILLPVSRKTVIGQVLNLPEAAVRDAGTQACIVQGWLHGTEIFRVHNVAAARQTLAMLQAIGGA